jgi:5'-3' exonuclease
MGIKHLNRYLLQNCSLQSIHPITFDDLSNKCIVVDTSIYLYKFLEDNRLLENFQLLIDLFNEYNINPIFVFDGKPPVEKKDLLQQRQDKKKEAESKYNSIINDGSVNLFDTNTINRLDNLKKKFIRINNDNIQSVRLLLIENKMDFIVADGEADELCVQYVKTNKAWACLSDDMDMFIFGCNRVLRNLSLTKRNVVLYVLPDILYDLKMSMDVFRDILVISGTDYNISCQGSNVCLRETLKWYKCYKKYCLKISEKKVYNSYYPAIPLVFYKWLVKNSKYINDYDELMRVHHMFIDT